jgi:hypothetical protein
MSYGRKILERVDALGKAVKGRFNVYFTVSVYDEFRRKCGDRAPSVVLEEMMKQFNETTPEPRAKK